MKGKRYEWTWIHDDGREQFVRAEVHGKRWKFSLRFEDEEEWIEQKPPAMEDLQELRALLFRRYQRGRVAWELVTGVEKLIRARGGSW